MRSSGTFVGPRRAPPVAVCRQRQWQVWVSAPSVASVPHQVPAVLADILLSRAFSEMLLALVFFFSGPLYALPPPTKLCSVW